MFSMAPTLVLGATGNIGREVVSQLTTAGAPVRAMTRHPEAARLPPQVEVVCGDLTLPESLNSCLDGVDSVFLIWSASPNTVAPIIERIAMQARRIVFLSSPHRTPHPFFQQPNSGAALHRQIERTIQGSGMEWTFLRPGIFAANSRRWWSGQIRAGETVRWPYPDVQTAPTDERDIAAVAACALLDNGHAGAEYVLTGPESLSQAEQLATIGRAIGRPIPLEEISPEEARRELAATMHPAVVDMLLNAWAAAGGLPALVTSTVGEITGKPARSFLRWATDHVAEFQA